MKDFLNKHIEKNRNKLVEISQFIYHHPELSFQEHQSSAYLCGVLAEEGFQVEQGAGGLETAFTASFQNGPDKPHIALLAEYDALPEIGHGCGHNLICTSSVGAAVALKDAMVQYDIKGKISVIGTPAEEGGGGKIILIDQGIFDDVDTAMMIHPTSATTRIAGECMSCHNLEITWRGKSAHSESHPEDGINALDAFHVFYGSVSALRQRFPGDVRVSVIITEGGISIASVPDKAVAKIGIVSEDKNLMGTVQAVKNCAQGAALSTGCEIEIQDITGYLGRNPNQTLADIFKANFAEIGEPVMEGMPRDFGTTDFGNVSRIMPACNPYVSIYLEKKIANHTVQFKELADSPRAKEVLMVSSKVLSFSALDLLTDGEILKQAQEEFQMRKRQSEGSTI